MDAVLRSSLIVSAVLLLVSQPVSAQCYFDWLPGAGVPGADGFIYAMTTWDPDGTGPGPPVLVVGGSFGVVDRTPASRIALWNGSGWQSLGSPMGAGNVHALAVKERILYCAGSYVGGDGVYHGHVA